MANPPAAVPAVLFGSRGADAARNLLKSQNALNAGTVDPVPEPHKSHFNLFTPLRSTLHFKLQNILRG